MKILLNPTNNVNQRIPTDYVYNIVLTFIIAFAIIFIIYSSTPYSHCNVYLIKPTNQQTDKQIK